VIGDRQCLVTEVDGPVHQVLRMRGAVEEGEVGVTVQLGVPTHQRTISNICSMDAELSRLRTETVLSLK
jgi:hypothetical protein